MKRIIVLAVSFICLFSGTLYAETSIKAEVDKKTITTDETLTYKLIIASSEKKLPQPELPGFEGFQVISQAQSSTVSFVKSNIKTILVYAFILVPKDKGKFVIGPSIIKIKDSVLSSQGLEIEVKQGRIKPVPSTKPQDSQQPQITL